MFAWLIHDSRRRAAAGALAVALVAASAGCFDSGDRPDRLPPPPPDPVAVDLTVHEQRIDGFGASSAWTASNIPDTEADLLFSPTAGIGLSLLRVQVKPEGITQEMGTARKAVARGAAVWAAPWSPPGAWKTNGTTQNGGSLLDQHRQDWADRLASFALTMSEQGVPLHALSVQNEPNYTAGWDTCIWTPEALVAFVRDYLGPALAARGLSTPIIAPESQDWSSFSRYASAFAADTGAMQYVGVFAAHNYGGSPHTVDAVQATGKPVWQTEVSDSMPLDVGMGSALKYGLMIHSNLVSGRVSAWHYWWIRRSTEQTNSALIEAGQLTRRAYVLGNWSRFVRPGALRVAATAAPQAYLYVTAFIDPTTNQIAIVAINDAQYALDQAFSIGGGTVAELTPWLTSADVALTPQAPVAVSDGTFSVTLPPRSVTTFVGTAAL